MKAIPPIVSVLCLVFGAWACRSGRVDVQKLQARPQSPVSVAFLGFTNRALDRKVPGLDVLMPEAAFQVTNHSDVRLTCQVTVDAFRPGSNKSEVHTSEFSVVGAHNTEVFFEPVFKGTNGWRYVAVVSSGCRIRGVLARNKSVDDTVTGTANEIAGANAGLRAWFFEKSLIVLSFWPGVARLARSCGPKQRRKGVS